MRGKGLGVRRKGSAMVHLLRHARGCFEQPLFLAACVSVCSVCRLDKTPLAPPQDVRAFDTPSDGGGSLTVLWSPAPYDSAAARYQVLLSEGTTVPDPAAMKVVAEFPANQHYVRESKWPWWTRPTTGDQHQFTLRNGRGVELKDGTAYSITVAAVLNDDRVNRHAGSGHAATELDELESDE